MKNPYKILPAADVKKSTDTWNLMRIGNEYKQLCTLIDSASKEGCYSITTNNINEKNQKILTDLGYEVTSKQNPNGNNNIVISWE